MKVKDLMSTDIVSVEASTSLTEVAKVMKKMNIGAVPVCEENRVTGIITDRDIVTRSVASEANNKNARDVMTGNVSTITSSSDIHNAAEIMAQKQIRRLPVVDEGKLVGIISLGDIAVTDKLHDNAGEALSCISENNI